MAVRALAGTWDHIAVRPRLGLELGIASLLFAALAAAFGYVLLGPDNQHQAFRDFGPASLLNAFLTAHVGLLGLKVARNEARQAWTGFWFVSGIAFFFLSIDGPLDLHGYAGGAIQSVAWTDSPPGIDRWSDAVLIMYLVLGTIFAAVRWREVVAIPVVFRYLVVGAMLTVLMLAIDSSGSHSPWTIVTEETVELLASSSIVGAYALRYSASRRAPGFAALE